MSMIPHEGHSVRQYFVTAPTACPYLPARLERRLVTPLQGASARRVNDGLSRAGFRRSHGIAYAPACPNCAACVSVRIDVRGFVPGRAQRRILRRNHDLVANEGPPVASPEQYVIFAAYQRCRHADGDMVRMDYADFRALIEDTPVDTTVVEFRAADGRLVAACLADRLADGLSAVYSFFDPARAGRSLGRLMILWLIERARVLGLPYVYLGFWIGGSRKMSYKDEFQPLEAFGPGGWRPTHRPAVPAASPAGAGVSREPAQVK